MPALQGFIVEWPLATPTIGFSKSPSPKPTARSIARFGERATPWVIRRERRFARVVAMQWSSFGSAILAAGARAIQCRRGAPVILCGYGTTGIVAVAVFLGRRRAVAFRSRGRGAAYLTAAAVPRDPRPGAASRGRAVRPQPAARRAHARR